MAKPLFYLAFILLFCVGGALVLLGAPFRMASVSLLVLALVPLYGIRIDGVAKLFAVFVVVILVSGALNHSSVRETLLFMRFVITPFAMYYLADLFLSPRNIRKVLNLSVALAMIQLPIVIFQRLFYDQIASISPVGISRHDIGFGSFYMKDDPALCFFLIGLILFLLFDEKHNWVIKGRMFKSGWFTVTVLLTNSVICQMMLGGIWIYYMLRRLSLRTFIQMGFVSVFGLGMFTYFGWAEQFAHRSRVTIQTISFRGEDDMDAFLSGNYSRAAAIVYYLEQPLKWLGDGPSRYYDPVTGTHFLGNTGQLFSFYGELGLLGLLLGYWLLFRMSRRKRGAIPPYAWIYFLVISGLTVTTSVMSDASIMLAYNLFLSTGYIHHKRANLIGHGPV